MTSGGVNSLALSPPACPSNNRSMTLCHALRRRHRLSCRAGTGDLRFDRRDVLAGLTGVAAAGGAYYHQNLAAAVKDGPFCNKGMEVKHDMLDCQPHGSTVCPPPSPTPVVDFTRPSRPVRLRKPAHLADPELMCKYRLAVHMMKKLPDSDPRSFASQAAIHEAYCNGHYRVGMSGGDKQEPEQPFDVHFSWIFAPWHRMYIYFYERILGSLIDDDSFALPYWNWDAPRGMGLPAMFHLQRQHGLGTLHNSLYDANRNPKHVDAFVVLDYYKDHDHKRDPIPFDPEAPWQHNPVVNENLSLLHHQMIVGGKGARCFLGEKFCTEDEPKRASRTAGTLDRMAHTGVHIWLGHPNKGFEGHCGGADMGILGTAARDPVFYTHHANVDRMWHLWTTVRGHNNFKDPNWLDTSFAFFDENKQLVRIRVRDVLHTTDLGYRYEEREELRWLKKPPKLGRRLISSEGESPLLRVRPPSEADYPLELKRGQNVVALVVDSRPAKEKSKPLSLLFDEIAFDHMTHNKFDVVVNVPPGQAGGVGPQWPEYGGTFATLARSHGGGGLQKPTSLELPLEDVLDDIAVEEGETFYVVLVPRNSGIIIMSKPRIVASVCDEEYQK